VRYLLLLLLLLLLLPLKTVTGLDSPLVRAMTTGDVALVVALTMACWTRAACDGGSGGVLGTNGL